MMATDFATKGQGEETQCTEVGSYTLSLGFDIRVNAIAPGLFPSELTLTDLKAIDEHVDDIAKGWHPVPAKRAGRYDSVHRMPETQA